MSFSKKLIEQMEIKLNNRLNICSLDLVLLSLHAAKVLLKHTVASQLEGSWFKSPGPVWSLHVFPVLALVSSSFLPQSKRMGVCGLLSKAL